MVKFVSVYTDSEYILLNCPFCGGAPDMHYIGNEHTKSKKINIKCGGCRVQRTNAAMKHDFKWLEEISVSQWNERKELPND